MYIGSTIFRFRGVAISLAVVAWTLGVKAADSGKSSGQSIIISTPKNRTTGTDVNLLGTGKYGASTLGNGSLDVPNSLSSQSSLSGLMAPPALGPSMVIRGGQIEDMPMLDQRKDWVFLSPEEYILGLSPREAAILQGSQDENENRSDFDQMYLDQSLSPAARFYQSLILQQNGNQQSRTSDQNQQSQNDLFGPRNNLFDNNAYRMQDSGLKNNFSRQPPDGSPTGIAINASRLENALNSVAPANNVPSASDFSRGDAHFSSGDTGRRSSSPFGLGQFNQSSNDGSSGPSQNDYVALFKALLNPQTSATTPLPAPIPFGNTTSADSDSGLTAGFGVVTAPTQVKTFNPQWSNPGLLRGALPTVGATADSKPVLGPTQPAPVVNVMQPQTFAAPKRWF